MMNISHTLTTSEAQEKRVRRAGFSADAVCQIAIESDSPLRCVDGLPPDASVERSYCHNGVFWIVVSSESFDPVEPNKPIPAIEVMIERVGE